MRSGIMMDTEDGSTLPDRQRKQTPLFLTIFPKVPCSSSEFDKGGRKKRYSTLIRGNRLFLSIIS